MTIVFIVLTVISVFAIITIKIVITTIVVKAEKL
jgi:hypothetical protein